MTKIFKIPVFKNGMLKDVGVIASGSALGYVVAFIASPVLTRLYSPDDFGLFTVYLSLYSIFSMLIAGKYDNAIPLPLTEKTATHVAKLALVISLFTSFLIFLCTISFGDRFLSFIHSSALKEYLWLLPLSLLLVGIYQVLFNWALRRKAFGVISYNGFQQRLIQVLVQIVCGFISFGALGLIGGFIMAQVLSLFTLYLALDAKIILLQKAKIASLLSVAKRYRRFPIFTGSATLINVLNMQSVTIFLAFLYEPRVVGLFGLATRLLGIPVTLIAMSISQVLFMKIVGLIKTDAKMLPKVFLEMTRILTFISFPVLCLFMFLGTGLVGLIFGKEWGEASLYLRVMVVMSFFQIVAEPLGPVLIALEKQRLHFLREVFHMILILLVFGAAYIFKFKVMFFLSVFVGAEVFYYVLHLLISWMAIKVYLKETLPQE